MYVCIVCIIDEGKTNERRQSEHIWHFGQVAAQADWFDPCNNTFTWRHFMQPPQAHLMPHGPAPGHCLPTCLHLPACLPVCLSICIMIISNLELPKRISWCGNNAMSCCLRCASLSPLSLCISVTVASFPVLGATQHRGACEINLCNYVTVTAAAPGTAIDRVSLGEKERAEARLSDRHQFGNRSAFCHLLNSVGNQHR